MLKTTNQRLAALILAGGAVGLLYLLWFLLSEHFKFIWAWFDANLHFLSTLTDHDFIEPYPDNPITLFSVVAMSFFTLSYFSGWLLSMRLLLKDWREMRALHITFNVRRFSAMLILIGAVFTTGSLIWYMDYCHTGLAVTWFDTNLIVASQLSESVTHSYYYGNLQIRSAHVTMAALDAVVCCLVWLLPWGY